MNQQLNQQPTPGPSNTQTQTQPLDQQLESNKKKWIIPIIIVIVIVTFIGSLFWFLNSSKTQETSQETTPQQKLSFSDLIEHPEKADIEMVVSEFLTLNQQNNKTAARKLLSSQANQESFASTLSDDASISSPNGTSFKFNIIKTTTNNLDSTALTDVKIDVADFTIYQRYTLQKEGINWKLTDTQLLDFEEYGKTTPGNIEDF